MKLKVSLATLLSSLLFFSSVNYAHASLVHIALDGKVTVNVLGTEDSVLSIPKKESLQINDIAASDVPNHASVSLSETDGKINLNVATDDGQRNLDVTNYKDNLIEIEERDKAQKVQISLIDGRFSIEQNGVIALTDFPININPKNAEISVTAPSGIRYLAILPDEAYRGLLKAKIISTLGGNKLTISEGEKGELSYVVPGQKVINLFNLFSYPIEVRTTVSASTGEVLSVDEPVWLKVLNLFLVEGVKV